MKKWKAAIYGRFSSDNQRDESIDAQVRAAQEYADKNDWEVVKVYADRAKSATTDKRPDFQHMIEDSGKGLFDFLIIHKLDRFSRDKYDSVHYKRILKRNGVRLVSVLENLDNSPESIILESVLEGMAAYYSQNLAREVRKGLKENALKCQHTGGIPPLGYNVDPATKRYVINENEAETVRLIFRLYLDGLGYNKIISELNARGHRTKVGKLFGKNSLHDLLANEKYGGTYLFNRAAAKDCDGRRNNHKSKDEVDVIRIEGGVPAIVSPEMFQQAQEKMLRNRHQAGSYKAKEIYLLSGLIVCGECLKREGRDYAMMGNSRCSGRGKNKHVTYRCGHKDRTKECCNREVRREYLEAFILTELEKNIFNEKAIPRLAAKLNAYQAALAGERESEAARAESGLTDVARQIENIVSAIANGIAETSLTGKLVELEAKQAALETASREIALRSKRSIITEDTLRGLLKTFRQYVTERNIPEVRKFIGNYVEKVIVYKDHVEVVFVLVYGEKSTGAYKFTVKVRRRSLLKLRWAKVVA